MRRHRENVEDHENHERWLVSYADFITLLFAFFVVMYAVSSINEGKYRVLSDVLESAFRSAPRSLRPIELGQLGHAPAHRESPYAYQPQDIVPDLRPLPLRSLRQERRSVLDRAHPADGQPAFGQTVPEPSKAQPRAAPEPFKVPHEASEPVREDPLAALAGRLREAMSDLIRTDLVEVRRRDLWVEVEIKNNILFPSGSATLGDEALEPLGRIAAIMRDIPNRIQVEGFTDNLPIKTPVYPSNWELSAARAASVVHLLMRSGVRPERMTAIGYGEYRPIEDNATEQGRMLNRRVVLVILGASDAGQTKERAGPVAGEASPATVETGPARSAAP